MARASRLAIAAALSLAFEAVRQSPASAQAASDTTVQTTRAALDSRRTELETTERRARDLETSLTSIADERQELNKRLIETAALVQKSEAQLTAIEARLTELEGQETKIRASLAERNSQISKLLAALQRMGRNPPPVMITRREDALKMVRSAMLLATAFPELRTQALELAGKLDSLVRIMTDIRGESEKLKTETERLDATRTRLASLMDTKKQTITERQTELAQVRQAAAEISKNVTDLNDLIAKLGDEVGKSAKFKAFEKESARQIAAAAETPAPVQESTVPASTTPPATPDPAAKPRPAKQKEGPEAPPGDVAMLTPPAETAAKAPAIELAPAAASLVPGSHGRMQPALAFELAKGRLPLPAQGRQVLSFGDKTQYGGTSKGIVIETRFGGQVISPCDGWVVFAGEFRSYGQLLIINATGGYHVLVAGMSAIDVEPGQFVLAAEPVGTMSGAPRTALLAAQSNRSNVAQGTATASSPVLYVEFRKDGQPIDPDPWWVGNKKVQN
jgi:septal ring factor EnvC (AmiA/AmiB activator)